MLQSETVKKYDTYKDSGIDWIGKIPSDWNITRLKFITDFKNGLAHEKEMDVEGKYCVINSKFVSQEGKVRFYCNEQIMPVYKNDICIVLSDVPNGKAYAKCYIVEEDNCYSLNQRIGCFYNIKINQKFFYYYINRSQGLLLFDDGINQTNLRKPDLLNLPFLLPKEQEQQRIAEYLDKKCGEIDRVVETEKAVIEKLKEYKQSIITEAVTKGLDKSVPLKDSGIEWIGKIPQHWGMLKLKYIAECNREVLSENTEPDKCIDYIEIGSVTNESGINGYETLTLGNAPSRARRIVNNGDTIISTVRTYLKAIAYIDDKYDKFICSTGFAVFTPNKKVLPKFLFHALHSEWFVSTVEANSVGISYPAINTTNIVNYKIAIPSVKEQEQILKYLDKKCSEIDKAIADKEQVIEKFTEYKKSLIYECVTGKRKVVE